MTSTEANPYAAIKAYERGEFERLGRYLEALDADGWVEQSYCTDWLVYQVVLHIGSGSRIGRMRLESWVNGAPPATREVMQGVTLDPGAERPRLQPGASANAPLVVEGPDEEIMRFVAGRHFVPGTRPRLKATTGTPQDLANLRRAFR